MASLLAYLPGLAQHCTICRSQSTLFPLLFIKKPTPAQRVGCVQLLHCLRRYTLLGQVDRRMHLGLKGDRCLCETDINH